MKEGFRKLVEWVKTHKALAIALTGGVFLLIYLYYSSQQQAAAAQAAAAQQTGTTAPDDTIQSLEIQAGAQLQAAQISAQATTAQTQAALEATQLQYAEQTQQNNAQTQAALTLGLAQAGDSTASILQLLGAQPGETPIPTTVTPTTSTVSTATGTGNETQVASNPAPVTQLPPAQTPAQAATQLATQVPYTYVTPSSDPSNFSNDNALYEQDVTGTVAGGGSYTVNNTYYATPAATANLAQILGTQAVVSPSVVGASGGPFMNPATEDVMTPSGEVDAGQILSELQNTAPGQWSNILGGYGIQDTATVNSQIYNMFGANQAVPETGAA